MRRCFVIQPFDGGAYDRRFSEIYKPAIDEVGLEAYRVDQDPSTVIPIENIHREIESAEIIFADISEDNPNIWYELGYALALNKPVIMACSEKKRPLLPFDIRHRTIILYKTDSPSDFEKLKDDITAKMKVLLDKESSIGSVKKALKPIKDDLTEIEKSCMAIIMGNQITDADCLSTYNFSTEMSKMGYNDLGTNITLRKLERKGFVSTAVEYDYNDQVYSSIRLTPQGTDWIIDHENEFVFTNEEVNDDLPFDLEFTPEDDDDDLPF